MDSSYGVKHAYKHLLSPNSPLITMLNKKDDDFHASLKAVIWDIHGWSSANHGVTGQPFKD